MEKQGVKMVFYADKNYPFRLKQCDDGPLILYYKGENNFNFDKIIKPPLSKIELNKSLLNNLNKNIEKNIVEKKLISKENLLKLSRLLYSNSIAANLKKGYSILTKKNKIVKTSKDIKINDSMKAQLQNGSLEIVVKKIN